MRWRDTDDDGGLDEELYYLQDFRGDVTGLALDYKHGVVERVRYGLTGRPEVFPPADVDFDGDVDTDDADAFDKALNAFIDDPADYDPRADLDHDGVIDYDDETLFLESHGLNNGLEGNWKLSQGAGTYKTDQPADGLDNRFGWRGYWYDPKLELYHVRHRVFDPRSGRWMQVDPLGFAAGDQDLYRYCGGNYSTGYDPTGLIDGYSQAVTFDPQTGEGLCTQEFMFGRPIGPGEAVNGRNSSGDALDQAANFFGGWAHSLTFGGTGYIYGGDHLDHNSSEFRTGAIVGSVHMAMLAGGVGGNLAVASWGLRAGSTGAAILGGAAGGMVGDYAFQHSMIATGMQGEYNPTQTLAMGALGGYLGYAFHGIAGLLSAPTASVDMVAARAALAADATVNGSRGAAGGVAAGASSGGTSSCIGASTPWAPIPAQPTAYSVSFQTPLARGQLGLSDYQHIQIANRALQAERAANPALAEMVPAPIRAGRPPANWTWQHATIEQGGGIPGVMQLVPASQHAPGSVFQRILHPLPHGGGGYAQWAIPAGAPPRGR